MKRLPNFIIAGVQRCGTTSMYARLCDHPKMSGAIGGYRREVHFFDYHQNYQNGTNWYMEQFDVIPALFEYPEIFGEKSPTYLQHPLVPGRIKEIVPNVKIIVMLRNPVDRAYSNYWKAFRKGFLNCAFEEALRDEPKKLKDEKELPDFWQKNFAFSNHHLLGILERGRYAEQLERWFEVFDREQILIMQSEKFYTRQHEMTRLVFEFLGVGKHEKERTVHSQRMAYIDMEKKTRRWLRNYYKPLNEDLFDLLGERWDWK